MKGLKKYISGTGIILSVLASVYSAEAQTPAFPGAEGYGRNVAGGRGGRVIVVTNLNDDGPGSLREAIKEKGPRVVVFAVSGTITLQSKISIKSGDLTIAGQSAPGDGICLRNYTVTIDADNIIVRYVRFRLGEDAGVEDDAFNGKGHKDIIIDHCSMSWAVDECASFYDNKNFTMQWCIISESLKNSVHSKGPHGYGGIWGGEGASFHHNLLADHESRLPRFCGSRYTHDPKSEIVDFRNNVIYNWEINSSYGGEEGNQNVVANYYKSGPATNTKVRNRIVKPDAPYGRFYVAGNYVDGFPMISDDNWKGGVQGDGVTASLTEKPFPFEAITEQTAEKAYELVLKNAGASYKRDAVDERVVKEVRKGVNKYGRSGIIDSPKDVGGWPELKSLPAPEDKDGDGMPDAWEKEHNLDPGNSNDAAAYTLDKSYTNIEVYLNSIVQ
ncbi:pectate lyase family protein [Chitinophagaceae bacterium MMS25-I14]